MRVKKESLDEKHYCEICVGHRGSMGCSSGGCYDGVDDYGSWALAVKAYEGDF